MHFLRGVSFIFIKNRVTYWQVTYFNVFRDLSLKLRVCILIIERLVLIFSLVHMILVKLILALVDIVLKSWIIYYILLCNGRLKYIFFQWYACLDH